MAKKKLLDIDGVQRYDTKIKEWVQNRGYITGYTDTNSWRKIQVNGVDILDTGVTTNPLNLSAGTNIELITASTGTVVISNNGYPVGTIVMWYGSVTSYIGIVKIANDWLLCNGASISGDSQYDELITVMGGATAVPDLTGKFPLGANTVHTPGSSGGTESETLTINEIPSHSHTITKGYHYGGSSEIGADVTINTYNLNSRNVRQTTADALVPEDFNPVNYVDLNGGGQPHNNMPPYLALHFIIKYK